MAQFRINKIRLTHLAASVPVEFYNNENYDWISSEERSFLIKNAGIHYRRIAPKTLCTSDMCVAAAESIFKKFDLDRNEIDVLIFVSQSPDFVVPATSITIQDRLNLSKSTLAFDINLGCSGYIYGLSMVASLLSAGHLRKALLLVGDRATDSQNYRDKTSFPIFGDAGTATIIEFTGDENDEWCFQLESDGSRYKSIHIPDGGTRHPFSSDSEIEIEVDKGIIRSRRNLHMDGMAVFSFSIEDPPRNIRELCEMKGLKPEDHDYVVLHQANKLINDTILKKLKVPKEKAPSSLAEFGNTSSASIPLTLVTRLKENENVKDGNYLLAGFGVGLSWGSCSIPFKNVKCADLVEL
jgi:3-oxoacyl-[acyl-carrier-protein] synthase III